MRRSIYLLFFFHLAFNLSFAPMDGFGSHQITLDHGSNTTIGYSGSGYTYGFTLPTSYTSITSYGLAWSGFKFISNAYLSFNANLTYNSGSTFTISLNPLQDLQIYYISFFILIGASSSNGYLQIISGNRPCTILNASTHALTENFQVSLAWNVSNSSQFKGFGHFSSMQSLQPTSGSYHGLKLTFSGFAANKGNLSLYTANSNQVINQISYTVVVLNITDAIYDLFQYSINSVHFYIDSPFNSSNLIASNKFSTRTQYGPIFSRNCSFSINEIRDYPTLGGERVMYFNALLGPIGEIQQSKVGNQSLDIVYWTFCMVQCFPPAIFYPSSTRCVDCWTPMPNCATCLNYTNCTSCINTTNNFLNDTYQCASCSTVIANCLNCTNNTQCLVCALAFYVNATSGCPPCNLTIVNCTSCLNSTNCTACLTDSYVDASHGCTLCGSTYSYCLTCNISICIQCITNIYYLDTNVNYCIQCNTTYGNCSTCNMLICNSCYSTLYYYNTVAANCYLCSDAFQNCATCTPTSCLTCNNTYNFYFSTPNCYLCNYSMLSCTNCSSGTICTACVNTSYYFNSSLLACFLCSSIASNCQSCALNGTTCTSCIITNTSYLTSTEFCKPCSSLMINCSSCLNSTVCITCDAGYAINSAFRCDPCNIGLPNCTLCSNSTVCIACVNQNYYLAANNTCNLCSNSITACSNCSSGSVCLDCMNNSYALLSNNTCQLCSSLMVNCATCTTQSTCLSCVIANSTYTSAFYNCVSCSTSMSNCATCSNNHTCLSCVNNNFAVNNSNLCDLCNQTLTNCANCSTTTICITCVSAFYSISINSTCTSCNDTLPFCDVCSSSTNCTTCHNVSFILNTTTRQCTPCSSLIANCNTCTNAASCLSCINNNASYVNAGSNCKLCSTVLGNCSTCSDNNTCTQCVNNYYGLNDSSQCNFCNQSLLFCSTCYSFRLCTSCISNSYFVNAYFQCTACNASLSFCLNCLSGSFCIHCQGNTVYLNGNSHECQFCSVSLANCLTCSSSRTCLSCLSNNYFVDASTSQCINCGVIFPYCVECNITKNVCTLCLPDFYFYHGNCLCKFGWPVIGNVCSSVPGCIQAQYMNNNSTNTICTGCSTAEFEANPLNGVCICLNGKVVTGICTTITGCLAMIAVNGVKQCVNCNQAEGFIMVNRTCVCKSGYFLVNGICTQVCGDGILFTLPCDDGNNVSGDGCSMMCELESSILFRCCCGTSKSPTQCKYIGSPLKLQLSSIRRSTSSNNATFSFAVSPVVALLSKMIFNNSNVEFNCSGNYTTTNISYADGLLSFLVDFDTDLEGLPSSLSVEFNRSIADVPNFKLSFSSVSDDFPLVVITNFESTAILAECFFYISLSALLVFVIGSISHKMIGVETIHTFQLIFFIQISLNSSTVTLQALNAIKVSNFYSDFYFNSKISRTMNEIFVKLKINRTILENSLIICVILIILFLIFLIFYALKIKQDLNIISIYRQTPTTFENSAQKQYHQANLTAGKAKLHKLQAYFLQFYNHFYFPFFIGFCLQFLFSVCINDFHYPNLQQLGYSAPFNQKINSTVGLFVVIGLAMTFAIECYQLFVKVNKKVKSNQFCLRGLKSASQNYVALYCLYIKLFFILMMVEFLYQNSIRIYYLPSLVVFYLICILIYRPYANKLHNAAIIINQIAVVIFVVGITAKNMLQAKIIQSYENIFLYVMIGLLSFVLVINTIRIAYEIRKKYLQSKKFKIKKESLQMKELDQSIQSKLMQSEYLKGNKQTFNKIIMCANSDLYRKVNGDESQQRLKNTINAIISPEKEQKMEKDENADRMKSAAIESEEDRLEAIKRLLRKQLIEFKMRHVNNYPID